MSIGRIWKNLINWFAQLHSYASLKMSDNTSYAHLSKMRMKNLKKKRGPNLHGNAERSFPKTFGYHELHKGNFPHLFNIPENQDKIFNSFPDVDFYGHKFMSASERQDFFEWYSEQNCKSFNFNEELYKYCLSDVEILKNGWLLYRKLFMEITKDKIIKKNESDCSIDPFLKCVTLTSACHLLYRRNFMQPK